ncbi:MAG: hypothetical protein OHK0017_06450 [Patescibacteria group bacterium]
MFSYFKQVSQIIVALLVVAILGGLFYLGYGMFQTVNNSPDKIVDKYVQLLESPTPDTISPEEEKILSQLTESGLVESIFSQSKNQLKDLRKFKQGNQVQVGKIEYTASGQYATVTLTFTNNFKNPKSKTAKLNLNQRGDWWNGGKFWKVYQIDMPEDDSILDKLKDQTPDFQLPDFSNPFK